VVPWLWFLTRSAGSRIFQDVSVPDILEHVLGDNDLEFRLTRTYEKRDYCVQYRESDFDFASRLMEEEGIFYFFPTRRRGHTMVIGDRQESFAPLAPTVTYSPSAPSRRTPRPCSTGPRRRSSGPARSRSGTTTSRCRAARSRAVKVTPASVKVGTGRSTT
jgi:uncharacterized protein involved in type VI secretion and phage assembly